MRPHKESEAELLQILLGLESLLVAQVREKSQYLIILLPPVTSPIPAFFHPHIIAPASNEWQSCI